MDEAPTHICIHGFATFHDDEVVVLRIKLKSTNMASILLQVPTVMEDIELLTGIVPEMAHIL